MFHVVKPSQDRLDLELSGSLDAEDMGELLDELYDKSDGIKNGQMLYRISDFSMPTLGALAVELFRLPMLFSLIGKFDRCAVLTDVGWIKTAAKVEGAMIPGLKIEDFDMDQVDAAEAWLAKGDAA